MTQMLAAVLHEFNDLRVEQVDRPAPDAPGSVLIEIKACGLCATDYKAIKGIRRNVQFPFIPGHEPSGVIAELGPGVSHFQVGDEVICSPSGYCGYCEHCRRGDHHFCTTGFTTGGDGPDDVRPGAFAQFMVTDQKSLYRKPPTVPFDAAALTEPLSGAWKGVVQYSEMQVGDDVVIIGVGSIGLLCLMVAKAAGAGRLIAIDNSPHARHHALALGATHAVDNSGGTARDEVYQIIADGPDLVVEAAGAIQAVQLMIDLRRRGTRWNLFGITTPETFELPGGDTHFLEGRMDASFGTTPKAMQNAIRLMERGLVDPKEIISHRFDLEKIHDAIEVMSTPDRNKIIIHP